MHRQITAQLLEFFGVPKGCDIESRRHRFFCENNTLNAIELAPDDTRELIAGRQRGRSVAQPR